MSIKARKNWHCNRVVKRFKLDSLAANEVFGPLFKQFDCHLRLPKTPKGCWINPSCILPLVAWEPYQSPSNSSFIFFKNYLQLPNFNFNSLFCTSDFAITTDKIYKTHSLILKMNSAKIMSNNFFLVTQSLNWDLSNKSLTSQVAILQVFCPTC